MIRILFLCTGNSARSILAEQIANQRFGHALDARSAGSHPKGAPHPLALATLARHGLSVNDARSEPQETYADHEFDLVITLCDAAAAEPCPAFPGAPSVVHWGLPDPPAADDPAAAFEAVHQALAESLGRLAGPGDDDLRMRAEAARPTLEPGRGTPR